jgi:hypothetical protein
MAHAKSKRDAISSSILPEYIFAQINICGLEDVTTLEGRVHRVSGVARVPMAMLRQK